MCRAHGIVIVEDDPYCWIALPAHDAAVASGGWRAEAMPGLAGVADPGAGGDAGDAAVGGDAGGDAGDVAAADAKPPRSYLSLDTDGRVVRLDSFAKFVSPGLRVGFVSAPPAFLEKFKVLQETSAQFPSGVAQAALLGLLRCWGRDGLDAHLRALQRSYTARRAALLAALADAFGDDGALVGAARDAAAAAHDETKGDTLLATWSAPSAGMFLWVHQTAVADTRALTDELIAAGVALVPGGCFQPPDGGDCPDLRLTFAAAPEDDMRRGAQRLAAVLRTARDRAGGAPDAKRAKVA